MTIKAIVFDAYGTLYDVQSVSRAVAAVFPAHADYITQVWRLKQLEYSWLHSLMNRYEDFRTISRESLLYTLATLGLAADDALLTKVLDAYNTLSPYPETQQALAALSEFRLAILSNGSPEMLQSLVENSSLADYFQAVISVDARKVFKPDPRAYELIPDHLKLPAAEVVFVSSNGFDVAGARSFGLNVVQVERASPASLQVELTSGAPIGPFVMFKASRMQEEALGYPPTAVVTSLQALPAVIDRLNR